MSKVKAIPDGYHTLTPNIIVRDGAAAIDFYKKAFGAVENVRMPGPGGSIMHAELRIGDSTVMLSDEIPNTAKSPAAYGGSPVSFYVYVEDVESAWKRAVDAGAKIVMPLTDMFWGDRLGALDDPFGHRWSLAQHTRDLTPEEIAKGQKAFLARMQNKS